MAATRKKQEDAENLKTLRELVSLPHNKHCFDCNQRGPTYVNVTIGSFICTKCSGMLRGLTPPHRVKSISMATFTGEEIALLQNRGNDYCRRTWLGLYEGSPLAEGRDEQQIHDFMIDKYERRRYYLEAAVTRTNGAIIPPTTKPPSHLVSEPKALRLNGVNNDNTNSISLKRNLLLNKTPAAVAAPPAVKNNNTTTNFIANFESADIFNAVNITAAITTTTPANRLSLTSTTIQFFNNTSMATSPPNNSPSNFIQQKNNVNVPPAPPEDRYAALKDLDNALKNQSAVDWNSGSSSGSLYSSSTPAGSMYSSPSPQSMYGSPSQGHFGSVFSGQEASPNTSNPFNSGTSSVWGGNGAANQNPFKANGFGHDFLQQTPSAFPAQANGVAWTPPNPFKIGSANGHSSNPFL